LREQGFSGLQISLQPTLRNHPNVRRFRAAHATGADGTAHFRAVAGRTPSTARGAHAADRFVPKKISPVIAPNLEANRAVRENITGDNRGLFFATRRGARERRVPRTRRCFRGSRLRAQRKLHPRRVRRAFRNIAMIDLSHAHLPSRESTQHGAAKYHAQANKIATPQNSWNEQRNFGADFRRMFLWVRRLRRERDFFEPFFHQAVAEFRVLTREATKMVWLTRTHSHSTETRRYASWRSWSISAPLMSPMCNFAAFDGSRGKVSPDAAAIPHSADSRLGWALQPEGGGFP
jgi:hypothetical protein